MGRDSHVIEHLNGYVTVHISSYVNIHMNNICDVYFCYRNWAGAGRIQP
jgi:hypothetical protein